MTSDGGQEELKKELKRQDVARWLRTRVATITVMASVIVTIGAVVLVIVLQIPWLREPLRRIGFGDVNTVTLGAIVFMLAAVFFDIRNLASDRAADGTILFTSRTR